MSAMPRLHMCTHVEAFAHLSIDRSAAHRSGSIDERMSRLSCLCRITASAADWLEGPTRCVLDSKSVLPHVRPMNHLARAAQSQQPSQPATIRINHDHSRASRIEFDEVIRRSRARTDYAVLFIQCATSCVCVYGRKRRKQVASQLLNGQWGSA